MSRAERGCEHKEDQEHGRAPGPRASSAGFAATLRARAQQSPDTLALVIARTPAGQPTTDWDRVSFAELDRLVDERAAHFRDRGVRQADRVLFLVKPSVVFYASILGLLRLGAVPILIDPGMGMKRVLQCVQQIRPRVVVAIPLVRLISWFARSAFRSVDIFITVSGSRFELPPAGGEPVESSNPIEPDDDAVIAFTSGSTGPAKGVVFTHRMLAMQSSMLASECGWEPGQRMLMCFAAFVLFTVADGLTGVVPAMDLSKPAKAIPERIVEAANQQEVALAFASPIVWMNLVRRAPQAGLRFSSLRRIFTTGAPIPSELHEQLLALAPDGAELFTPYGATEALPLTNISSAEIVRETAAASSRGAGTCVGRPFPGVQLRIMRVTDDPVLEWSDDLSVTTGQIGEIVAGGEVVSPQYKDLPRANAAAKLLERGRLLHRMGDLGYMDEQGRLWFCGRKSERLETSSGMIAPVLVENVFDRHPKVFRSALVGVGEPGRQAPVLCVELEKGHRLTPELEKELVALADSTRWRGVVTRFLEHPGFPVDARHNTKIKRGELASWAAQRCGQPVAATQEQVA